MRHEYNTNISIGFDGAVHMSEEVRQARHAVPRAMFWSIVANGILAFGMLLVFLYCAGSVDDIVSSGYPLVMICIAATKSVAAGSAMVGMSMIVTLAVCLGSVTSASRITWAWSRDGALPAYFSKIDPKLRIPVRSIWLPIGIVMLLALLNIGSSIAFSVIVALSTLGLYQSYMTSILCVLYARYTGTFITSTTDTPTWSLGRYGVYINIVAVIYTAYMMVFLCFPAFLPITAAGFNYALPINAFVQIIALVWWVVWARKHWRGINEIVVKVVVADAERRTKD
jgi:choline transport protein